LIFNRLAILSFKYSRKIPVLAQKRPHNLVMEGNWSVFMSLQALCTVAISPTLDSRAYQCRTHSEAHKVLLRQYRRWCATCFGRQT
jgi:hypothetical protein